LQIYFICYIIENVILEIIMAVPKHRHTKSKRNKVRMHLYIRPAVLALCKKCKNKVLPYTVCKNCGYYKGQEVINVLGKLNKKEKKQREKKIQETEKQQKIEDPESQRRTGNPMTMEELSKK